MADNDRTLTGASRARDTIRWRGLWGMVVAFVLGATAAHAQTVSCPSSGYCARFTATTTGAVTFIGNTLGLSKASNQNNAGTSDAIGAFSTTDTTQKVGNYPNGTTLTFAQNSSTAILSLPAGSTVLYAELTWAGSYAYGNQFVTVAQRNGPVMLVDPNGTEFTINPDATFQRNIGTGTASGCTSSEACFYARSQNVTSMVEAGGNGVYTVRGVPGTVGASENFLNSAGWTLAVIYRNFSLPVRNVSLNIGSEFAGNAAAAVTGFCTPESGPLEGQLAVSAMEGDANRSDDQMRFGPTLPLGSGNNLSGANNLANNFFASQINGDNGNLVTSGTFGTRNANPATGTLASGGRQGWDITKVDVSSELTSGQTSAFAQGTRNASNSQADQYLITDLGLQINVGAPAFGFNVKTVDKTQTFVGDTLTYTVRAVNSGPIDATNVVFTDVPPPGTTFVSGSFKRNGVVQAGANPAAGVNIGTVAGGTTVTVEFKVQVTSVPASPAPAQYSNAASWTYQFRSCAGQPLRDGTFGTNTATTTIAVIDPTKQVSPASAVPNQMLTYTVTIPNTGTATATNVTLTDAIPMGTTYVAGSTTLNGVVVPDNAGMMPFVSGRLVNSPGAPSGQVAAGQAATVQFQVRVSANATGTVTNTAHIDRDGAGRVSRPVSAPVTPMADLVVTKSLPAPLRAVPGTNQVFIVTVTNQGPSNAAAVVVTDPTPPGLAFVSNTGACMTPFPCNLGALTAGESRTITATYFVPPSYRTPDPIVNTATVSSTTPDPASANNTAQIAASIDAPIADLALTKSDGVTSRAPGETTTYTITLQNRGPSDVAGVAVSDPVSAQLTGITWTCTPGPGASCAAPSGTGSIGTTVSLPVNAGVTFSLTGTLAPDAVGQLINTVTAQNPPGFGDSSPSSATDTDQIVPRADVSVTKTGPTSVVPGNTATYTIVVSNTGPSPAAAVTVSDPTPPGLTFVSNTGACSTPFPCNVGTIAAGASRTITTTFTVPFGYTTPNPIVETASVSSSTQDTNATNNTATAQTLVDTRADVAVSKGVEPASALVGDTVTLFVNVSNNGPNRASGVVVTDVLPAGLQLLSASPSQGAYVESTGQWLVGQLLSGERAGLVIQAVVTQAGTITNIATKTAQTEPDPDTGNDSASAPLNAAAAADVAVQKTVDDAMPSVGEVVTFTVTATNHGPSDVTGVVLTDVLPAGLGLQSATPSQGTYTQASGTWTVGNLALDASATLTLVATVNSTGMLVNTAQKTAQAEVDPNPLNDQSSVSLNAVTTADLEVTKAVSNAAPSVGEEVTFTVKATNLGPSPATGVVVNDLLPASLQFVSAIPSQGSYDAGTGAWTVGDLAATQSAVLSLTALVVQAGAFTNTATKAAANEPDPNPVNDSGSASGTASRLADLSVTKTDGFDTVIAGTSDTYTITVTNAGPTDVTGAQVADTFPATFTGVTWTCAASGGASCGAPSGTGNIATTANLPVGGAVTFTATGTVAPTATGTLDNTATVTPPVNTPDPAPANNSATDTTVIAAAADLTVVKTGPAAVTAGTNVVFTVAVTNAGPSTASNVVVSDPTPPGLVFQSNTGACTTAFPCSLGTLGPGATATITSTYLVPASYTAPDPIVNQASVTSGTPDPVAGNNTDQATVDLTAPVATLAVTKSDGRTSVVPGTATTYTITVRNQGPSDVAGVQVTDIVPPALGSVSWTCSAAGGGSCAAASGTGSIATTVSLPAGATATFSLTGTVTPDATGQLVNTVTAQNPPGFGSPTTASATDTDQLTPQADAAVTKTGSASVVPGNNVVYTIVASNAGLSTATGVVVDDPTPPGLTFVSNAGACTTPFPCSLGTLAPGASATITATFAVPLGYTAPNPIANTATVSTATPDGNAANDTATAETPVDTRADVAVTKSVTPTAAMLGDSVTLTIGVTNNGPNQASGVVVSDVLPAGLVLVQQGPGSYVPATGQWSVGTLASGASAQLVLEGVVTQAGTITNLATKTFANEPDPNTSNDSAAATLNAVAAADVAVRKTVDDATPSLGEVVTFTVTATNQGPSGATGVVLTDVLPVGLGFQSATPSQGAYDQPSGTWTVGDLALGASATLTLVATVNSTATLVNTAQKTAQTEPDPNALNDQASVSLNGATTADLEITKAVSNAAPSVGEEVTFTVKATNLGPSLATGVVVNDVLPAGLTFIAATPSQGSYNAGSGAWTVGNLLATQSATLALRAVVVQAGTFTNTATRTTSTEPDPNPGNDSGSASVTASRLADLSVTKSDDVALVVAGGPDTYTITVANAGPTDVTGAGVTDMFPAAFTGVTWTCTPASGSSCGAAAGTGDIMTTVDLPAGGSVTFIAMGTVAPGATGTLANTATVTPPGDTPDPAPANNSATDTSAITALADVAVVKTGPATTTAGTNVVFTVVITNAGPSTATNVVVTDPTPAGLTFVSNTGDCTTAFPCSLGVLAPGASATITATYAVPSNYAAPDLVNQASVASDVADPATGNNTARAAVSLGADVSEIAETKSNGVTSVVPGTATTYTITVQNLGPSDVEDVQVTDDVPAVLGNVTWTCSATVGGSCAAASGTGSIGTTVDLPVGAIATFMLTGTVAPGARGTLVNTVTTQVPAGTGDPSANTATDTDQLTPSANVGISKTGPAVVVPGNTVAYTIVVTNAAGPSTANDVVVADPTPSGLTFLSNSGACTTAFPCNLGPLAPNDTRTITTTFLVPAGYTTPNPIVETAIVSSLTPDPNTADNTATAQTPVDTRADVAVSKSVTPANALVGDTVSFVVRAANGGPNAATGVVVTDVLPAGLAFVTATPSQGAYDPLAGRWVVGDLNADAFAELTIQARVTQAGTITNIATKTAQTEPDPDTSNDSASAPLNAAAAADIAVQKTVDDAMPSVGETVTFTVTATNHGPSDATAVVLTDILPAGLGFQSATPSQGTYTQASGTWTVGNLALDASATLTLVATVNSTGMLVNTAQKSAQAEVDPNPLNDQSSVSLNAVTTADLEVTKAVSNAAPSVGEEVTFTVKATNLGPSPATGVVVNDLLPASLQFVSATPSQGTYDAGTGTWTVGDLAATQSAVLSLTALVVQDGAFTNTAAKAAATEPDPNAANDSASASGTASRLADLSVTKTDGFDTVIAGTSDTYTITVTNAGPTDVIGAGVTDTFPAAFTGVTWTCTPAAGSSCGTAAGSGDIVTTVDLPAGGSVTFTATGTVAPTATGTLANTATVTPPGDTPDPAPANNSATDTTVIAGAADLTVVKTGPAAVTAGTNVVFTVAVTNAGPSTASNVVVSDPTPPGLVFQSNTGACATAFPCSVGTLGPGATATITSTYLVPASYTAPDPIVNQASATSATPDPAAGNNTGEAIVDLGAPVAALAVTKTDGKTSIVPATATTYTITVQNQGPSDVAGVQVTDTVPAALGSVTWTCAATPGGSCAAASGTGSINTTVSLPVGATATFSLTGTVAADATGQLVNTVTAQNPSGFGAPSSASATDTNELTPTANLGITKTGPPVVVPGNVAVYTIVVTNAGLSAAAPVVVADPTPEGLVFVMNEGDCDTGFPCVFGALPPGETRTITATFLVPGDYRTPSPIVQTATVSSPATDPDSANNTATVETAVDPQADVSVAKFVTPADALVGSTVSFTVRVANNGPNTATDIVVTDVLPAGLDFVSASPSQGVYLEGLGGWLVGGLNSGDFAELTLDALVTQPGMITNFAAKTHANETDPDTSNDTAIATVNAAPAADVAVQKTVDDAMPSMGETVTFTVTATNRGPNDATGVVLTDLLPAGLGLVSATPSQGAYDQPSGTWTVGALAVDASATLTLVATVDSTGMLVNTAHKTTQTEADPDSLNDQASVSLNAVTTADLEVAKAVSNAAPGVGAEITFVVRVLNRGPSASTGVVVNDTLPQGLTFVSATPSQGTYDETTGVWTVGDLAASESGILALRALVTQEGPFINTASVPNSATDPNPANNSADASGTAGIIADLSIAKSDGDTTTFPGAPISYTITVENAGPSPVTGAPVTDPPPPGLTGVAWTCTATPPGSCGAASGTVSVATTVSLPASGMATIIVTGLISPDATGTLDNIARVDPPQGATDPNLDNNVAEDLTDLTPSAAVAITKAGPASATPGSGVTYTLVVTNTGPSAATDVVVMDPTPAGLVFVGNAGACTTGFPCSLGTLEPGGSRTIMSTYTALAGAMVVNVAMVTSPTPDPDIDDNTATTMTDVLANTDVALTKTGPARAAVGATATYTLLVVNNGPNFASNVTLTDPLPAGVELVSVVPSQGGCLGTSVDCVLGGLSVGQTVTVAVTVRILSGATGTLVNTATVATETVDLDLSNNTASAVVAITREADLALTKTAPAEIGTGELLTYALTVTNNGPSPATNVTLGDTLPAGVTPGTATASQGSCTIAGQTVTCALGDLGAATAAMVTITAEVLTTAEGQLVNTATVTGDETDVAPANNTASAVTAITGRADLTLTKTVSPDQVEVGGELTYLLLVANAGPAAATNVVLADPLPAAVTPGTVTASQGSCTLAGQTVTCALGDLAANATASVTITATREVPQAFSNTASITATEADPNPADNVATVTTVNATAEDCGNCRDDDSDGLVDAEDPDCCTPQALTFTSARVQPRRSRLRVKATLAPGAFARFDPRRQDVQLQIRDQDGEAVCCTIPQGSWKKVLGKVYWFRDPGLCPPIKGLCLIVPKKGRSRTVIIAGQQTAGTGLESPIDVTLSAGGQCVQGSLTLRPAASGGAVFP